MEVPLERSGVSKLLILLRRRGWKWGLKTLVPFLYVACWSLLLFLYRRGIEEMVRSFVFEAMLISAGVVLALRSFAMIISTMGEWGDRYRNNSPEFVQENASIARAIRRGMSKYLEYEKQSRSVRNWMAHGEYKKQTPPELRKLHREELSNIRKRQKALLKGVRFYASLLPVDDKTHRLAMGILRDAESRIS